VSEKAPDEDKDETEKSYKQGDEERRLGISVNCRRKMSDVCNETVHISHVDSVQDSF
jgi:hypothetical protein